MDGMYVLCTGGITGSSGDAIAIANPPGALGRFRTSAMSFTSPDQYSASGRGRGRQHGQVEVKQAARDQAPSLFLKSASEANRRLRLKGVGKK